jgi:hypothetical protein
MRILNIGVIIVLYNLYNEIKLNRLILFNRIDEIDYIDLRYKIELNSIVKNITIA